MLCACQVIPLSFVLMKIDNYLHQEIKFLDVFVCLSVCLPVFTITPKVNEQILMTLGLIKGRSD